MILILHQASKYPHYHCVTGTGGHYHRVNTLKTAFLLAAAATATQLDATIYNMQWSGAAYGNAGSATATMDLDLTGRTGLSTGFEFFAQSGGGLNSLSLTISGTGTSRDGTYTLAQVGQVVFGARGNGADITQEMVAQGGGTFNGWLHFYTGSAADIVYPVPNTGGSPGDVRLGSGPGAVPLLKLTFLGLGTPPPSGPTGVSDIPAWLSSINGQNRIYQTGVTLAELPLEGAHHRPMLSFDRMGKERQAWATGDFGSSSNTRDVHVTTGEAGVNWNVGKTGLIGFAAGHGEQNADLAFNGSSSTKGDYALVEYDYRPEGTQWIVSLLGMIGSWESKTNRGYTSGASTDFSFGVADIISRSARLRVDAPTLVTYGGFGFAPYASYSVTQTVVGAYTETGGAFPASFGEQEHNATEARIGVTATKDISAATKLLLTVEAVHRFDGVGPALTGQDVTGGVSFSLPGVAPRADCVRFGFDVDHKLNENTLLNVSAHVSTVGEAHDVSAAISIRRAF